MSRAYAHRRVRRVFSLMYVPVVRLQGEHDFVQCGFCRRAFAPSILATHGAGGRIGAARPTDDELSGVAASTLLVWDDPEDS